VHLFVCRERDPIAQVVEPTSFAVA
jgi:hypothetical protein